jgi:hypothetical protein
VWLSEARKGSRTAIADNVGERQDQSLMELGGLVWGVALQGLPVGAVTSLGPRPLGDCVAR